MHCSISRSLLKAHVKLEPAVPLSFPTLLGSKPAKLMIFNVVQVYFLLDTHHCQFGSHA